MPRAKGGAKTRQRRKPQMISAADQPRLKKLVPYL
jgi:ribosomal protein L35